MACSLCEETDQYRFDHRLVCELGCRNEGMEKNRITDTITSVETRFRGAFWGIKKKGDDSCGSGRGCTVTREMFRTG